MKEQWKKLDSDAKLMVDVEEGRELPIKINLALSGLTPAKDEFCCSKLLIVLKVCLFLALFTLLGWTIFTTFVHTEKFPLGEQSLENKFAFQSEVYQKKDDIDIKDEPEKLEPEVDDFKDSTKKALEQIAAQMKGFNERLDRIQVEKEQPKIEAEKVVVDVKPVVDDDEHADQTLDSMLDDLAKELGLEDEQVDVVEKDDKPELGAYIISDSFEKKTNEHSTDWLTNLGITRHPTVDNVQEENPFLSADIGVMVNGNAEDENTDIEQAQKEFYAMLHSIAAEAADTTNVEESHEDDKQMDLAVQEMINRIAASNLKNEDPKVDTDEEIMKQFSEDLEEKSVNEIIGESVGSLLMEVFGESDDKDASSKSIFKEFEAQSTDRYKNEKKTILQFIEDMEGDENIEAQSANEYKAKKKMLQQIVEHMEREEYKRFVMGSVVDLLAFKDIYEATAEKETKKSNEEDPMDALETMPEEKPTENDSVPDLIGDFFTMIGVEPETDGADQQPNEEVHEPQESEFLTTVIPESSDNQEQSSNEPSLSAFTSPVEMVPSVEYVKKIEENPFIPRVAMMLEPIVGQNHELLVWYYTHRNLPEFLRGADKWKVFGAKLLYDSNIKDYPADATIVSGLVFEKVYSGAEYPSSSEEIKTDLQKEIVNRLILKSYLNKMLLEGNVEAETLSEIIEQHNQQKLKELDIDPEQLASKGDFFEVTRDDNEEPIIPVVRFDPFVDESKEANEQRIQVIRAFDKTRILDEEVTTSQPGKSLKELIDSITYVEPEPMKSAETVMPETKETSEDSVRPNEWENTEEPAEATFAASISEEVATEISPSSTQPEEQKSDEQVDMNDYLTWYDTDPLDW